MFRSHLYRVLPARWFIQVHFIAQKFSRFTFLKARNWQNPFYLRLAIFGFSFTQVVFNPPWSFPKKLVSSLKFLILFLMSRKVTNEIKSPFFATFATFKAPTIMTAGTAGQKQTLFAVLFSIFFAHLWTLSSSSSDTQPPPHLSTNLGALLVTDKRVFTGPLGRSLRSFARTAQSAHSLRSRARSLTSLTPSWDSWNS